MQYGQFADFYDALMEDIPYKRWAAFIRELLGPTEGLSVLELAAGTGGLTLELAPYFQSWIVSDYSEDMLRIAAQKLRKAGLRLPLLQADMRDFSYEKPVDIVLCACDGINCVVDVTEVERCFRNVFHGLKEKGVFIFDISSAYKLESMDGQYYGEDLDGLTYIWQNSFAPESRVLTMDIIFFAEDGEVYRRFDERHLQRAHQTGEILALLKKAGFARAEVYENYSFRAPEADAQRITFAAYKDDKM